MILTKEQIEKRVSSPDNLTNKVKIMQENLTTETSVIIKDGKNHEGRPGAHNLTQDEKVLVGTSANLLGNDATAELFGISPHTARHLRTAQTTESHGRGTQTAGQDQELKNAIAQRLEDTKLTIQERAAEKLLKAFDAITDDKITNASLKEVAQVTAQMSQVMRNLGPQGNNNKGGDNGPRKVQIILHQPKQTKEEHFEVIEIGLGA